MSYNRNYFTNNKPLLGAFEKFKLTLTVTSSIFDPGPNCTRNSLNRTNINYGFHWKLKGDRAFILIDFDRIMAIFGFRHLQGVNCGQSWTKSSNFG